MPCRAPASQPLSRRAFAGGALAAAAALALGGCVPGEGGGAGTGALQGASDEGEPAALGATPVSGGTFKFAAVDVAAIDPGFVQDDQGLQVVACLFDALTAYDARGGQLVGRACTSWEASDDARLFTFHLREGAAFHNGDPVTSSSFAYAWNRLCSLQAAAPDALAALASVEGYDGVAAGEPGARLGLACPDEYTLAVSLAAPDPDFPAAVAHPATGPVPAGLADDADAFAAFPVGNGAFALKEAWAAGGEVRVVRNDAYVAEKPYVAGVDFVPYDDEEAAFAAFEAGELDFAPVPADLVDEASRKYGSSADGSTANPGRQVVTAARAFSAAAVASDRVNDLQVGREGVVDLAACWLSA
jgi:peptide/nickel transport system substrate-binding protein/oligopeptide transport system substrate-binding protein